MNAPFFGSVELFKLSIGGKPLQSFVPAAFLPIGGRDIHTVHGQRGAQTDVGHRRTHADFIAAHRHFPAAVAPDGKAAVIQREGDGFSLAGLQLDLSKAL